jgi:hypothetical protein
LEKDPDPVRTERLRLMSETRKKLPVFGFEIDVSEVPVKTAEEAITRYELEDGTVLKVKNVATAVLRVDNQWLPDGSPVYIVVSTPVVGVDSSVLKRPQAQEKGTVH